MCTTDWIDIRYSYFTFIALDNNEVLIIYIKKFCNENLRYSFIPLYSNIINGN